ncbi:oligopeptide/dipeptide ABC transporter ATP-binding protein [Janibacter melonis]|uniref:oligopeptide/dipeptide ABC transporter ATP-binding protein n=1 Tax=Janibacter melonis TaxID=262209 RepID=UPI003557428C
MVEIGDEDEVYSRPTHPYTQALLSAVPVPDPTLRGKRDQITLTGDVPRRRTRRRAATSTRGAGEPRTCAVRRPRCSRSVPTARAATCRAATSPRSARSSPPRTSVRASTRRSSAPGSSTSTRTTRRASRPTATSPTPA